MVICVGLSCKTHMWKKGSGSRQSLNGCFYEGMDIWQLLQPMEAVPLSSFGTERSRALITFIRTHQSTSPLGRIPIPSRSRYLVRGSGFRGIVQIM